MSTRWFVAAILGCLVMPAAALAECRFLLDSCDDGGQAPSSTPNTRPPNNAPEPKPSAPPVQTRRDTFWDHNGSVMRLRVDGAVREFYYEQPRPGIAAEGAKHGTLLFTGIVNNVGTINGTAWLFSRRCGPRSYSVQGVVTESGGKVVMQGMASTLTSDCKVKSSVADTIAFKYLYTR